MTRRRARREAGARTRAVAFFALAGLILAGAAYALWPRSLPADATAADVVVRVDMMGFAPAVLQAPAEKSVRILLVNPDNRFHSDGGGWHQFAVPALGIDAKIEPQSTKLVEIPPAAQGEYVFYCDVCCGGKENPSMQGVLRLRRG